MIRHRRQSPLQDAFDGLSARDAERLRALLGHSESKSPRAGDPTARAERGMMPSGPDPRIPDERSRKKRGHK